MANLDYWMARVAQPTGRKLVIFKEGGGEAGARAMGDMGLRMAHTSDFESGAPESAWQDADGLMFDHLGVACVASTGARGMAASAMLSTMDMADHVEDEMIRYALGGELPPRTAEYLRGYRDGVNHLIDALLAQGATKSQSDEAPPLAPGTPPSEAETTWGLRMTGAADSPYTGKGVKVAILDTGIDLSHPDFAGRTIVSASFISGETVQDGHGHGTHTAGTACGPRRPQKLPRYGVACDADLYIAKVLGNSGQGPDASILGGIDWAIRNGCRVISMSIGAITGPSAAYERAAQQALKRNAIVIAAAGNESRREQGLIAPVDSPANSPSVLAVAAIDAAVEVAFFSCAGTATTFPGAQVDIAGPGVDVHSSYKGGAYKRLQGTSMATPHVSGIAALLMEANPRATSADIWRILLQTAKRLPLSAADVGAGLAQAPMGAASASFGGTGAAGGAAPPAPAPSGEPAEPGAVMQVAVSVDMARGESIDVIADRLRAAGMVTSSVLSATGQVTGTIAEDKMSALMAVKGVVDVSTLRGGMHVPPPDAPVQ